MKRSRRARLAELWHKAQWAPWYSFLAWYVRRAGVDFRCMNWGYEDGRIRVEDPERYPLQLYEAVVEGIPLAGRTLVDVSCGRGGGRGLPVGGHCGF